VAGGHRGLEARLSNQDVEQGAAGGRGVGEAVRFEREERGEVWIPIRHDP
jgi:hypothetical protein